MATRAERVKEALEHVNGHEKVAFALAINDVPHRRQYFNAVCGYNEDQVVKALAKLANDGLVADTEGLEFRIASPEIAKDVREHMPEDVARELHSATLEWAEDRDDLGERFFIDHLIGAGEFALAGEKSLALRRAEEDPIRAKTWIKPMRLAFAGLAAREGADSQACVDLGLAVVRDGAGLLRPKNITEIFTTLNELALSDEQRAEIVACETWLKEERSRARKEAKKEAREQVAAEAAAQALELPVSEAPENGSAGEETTT